MNIEHANLLLFFKGLANENRQSIVFELFSNKQEYTVGEVAQKAGIALSTASQHLSVLKRSGVLLSEKRDREVFYRVNEPQVRAFVDQISDWLDCC